MVLFTLCLTLGVWLLQQQTALPDFTWAWLLLIYPLAKLVSAFLSRAFSNKLKHTRLARLLSSVFTLFVLAVFAICLGFFHAAWQAEQRLAISLPDEWQGRNIEVIGVVAKLPRIHDKGQRFNFKVEQVLTPEASVPNHIYLSTYLNKKIKPITLKAGERWRLTLRLKQPHGSSNPHGFDFEAWALENNIRAVGYVHNKSENVRLDTLADGLSFRIESWRETIRDKFVRLLGDKPYVGVLSALTIGDQSSIPSAQWQVFTRTGVNHLMSISGLHITMLSGLGFAISYWLWRRSARSVLRLPARKAAALVALLVALFYALLSGFAVPAQRTVYMVAAVTAALWLNRNFSLPQILSIALLGVITIDPWAVISPGFWLSFGAVSLIMYVSAYRINRQHNKNPDAIENTYGASPHPKKSWLASFPPLAYLMRVLKEYANIQWAMSIGLIPLLLGLFQQVSLVSPLANAVAIPLVSLIVVPLSLLGAALPIDTPLQLAHLAMDGVIHFLEWLNAMPQVVWQQHAPPTWSIVAGMLGVLVILLPRGFPARWTGFLLLMPMFLNTPEPPAAHTLRMIIFDVGQGLAVVAQTRQHTLLYDAGPDFSGDADSGNRILIPALHAMGINQLDGLMLTHDDIDHTGGAASVMQNIPTGWLSSSLDDEHPLSQQINNIRRCQNGQTWQWDGVNFEVLYPDVNSYAEEKIKDNDRSCVLRISIGDQHILLTADIERKSEWQLLKRNADKLPATLLLVPHHGSNTSSTVEFINAVSPDYAVFTVGYRSRYGHPKPEVTQRYRDAGIQLLRSDMDGAIVVEMNAQGIQLERYRMTHRRYWTHAPYVKEIAY